MGLACCFLAGLLNQASGELSRFIHLVSVSPPCPPRGENLGALCSAGLDPASLRRDPWLQVIVASLLLWGLARDRGSEELVSRTGLEAEGWTR